MAECLLTVRPTEGIQRAKEGSEEFQDVAAIALGRGEVLSLRREIQEG